MPLDALFVAAGLVLLLGGAWLVVRSASNLAALFGLSPVLIGATVVAFGTSAPEFVVSGIAAVGGNEGVALGNVVGSNISNVALVLGLAALIMPVTVDRGIFRRDVPVLFVAVAALLIFSANGALGRLEGAVLFAGLIAFIVIAYRMQEIPGQQSPAEAEAFEDLEERLPPVPGGFSARVEALLTAGGIAILAGGAQLFVGGATEIASRAGVSEFAIGATLVATGTSLPEVATSAVAAYRGLNDIAVANVVGSNIFNALGVIGFAALAAPIPLSLDLYQFEMPVLALSTVLLVPLIRMGRPFHLGRLEGGLLFASFFVFTAAVLLRG